MYIGIPGSADRDGKFGVNSDYMEFISAVGDPIILPPMSAMPSWIDGVVLPGGADLDTSRYFSFPGYSTFKPDIYLEHFDKVILPGILGKMPIFGICRGLQTINVCMGGTLIQHLYNHPYSSSPDDEVHTVCDPAAPKRAFKVNSFHHQCINKLASGIKVEMVSDDKIIEAISGEKFFAVQWHPERLMDTYSIRALEDIFK